ncbi:unnamed protein product [Bursaphelenchus xylophilus]|uniref:mannose-6-phosphate isomerase n=1 Tax=Bursaphelenchus xylophilus TaxID=6326 RepID=A0A1I7RSE4_BURXY|nr:unnamed protein product [Bursaphelenchus xylophilus]CAG9123012.1 unnamed protein product [Bursaphelenchus xylophilus]
MHRLHCHVQNYQWGKKGASSEVGLLYAAGHKKFMLDEQKPYAELWMGTHPDGPARIQGSDVRLSEHRALEENNEGDDHLPFIMKIMAIEHTLSLQVHPTKEQATQLHDNDPFHYPDRNHKPELAYALNRFELLCGFRPAKEILINMEAFPEIKTLMGIENCQRFKTLVKAGFRDDSNELKQALKACFTKMIYIKNHADVIVKCLEILKNDLDDGVRGCLIEETVEIMKDTMQRFPGDVGCFAPLYLNHMILEPGQCCYYAAEELHAYLSGECVECVGCSNNTIRAGLTNKFVDKKSLIEVLNYRMTAPEYYLVPPKSLTRNVAEYAPENCADFTLHEIKINDELASSSTEAVLPTLECASIIVFVSGDVEVVENGERIHQVTRGDIYYIPKDTNVMLTRKGDKAVLAYRTLSYEDGPDHSTRINTKELSQSDILKLRMQSELRESVGLNNNQLEDVSVPMEVRAASMNLLTDVSGEMDGFL